MEQLTGKRGQYNSFVEQDLAILTPEKTVVTYRLAGLGSRIGAHLLDLLLILSLFFGFSVFTSIYMGDVLPDIAIALILLASVLFPLLYFILLEGLWNGQTVGKKACSIRVRMADGTPVTFAAALGRNLLRPADMLPGIYLVGLIAIFTNPRSQRIGDLVANTVVCHDRRPLAAFTPAPHAAGIHPLESYVGPLRGMTMEEYNALRRYADRFPELPAHVQERLTEELWAPIADRRSVPPLPNVHPIYLAEAVVMKYGREHGLL